MICKGCRAQLGKTTEKDRVYKTRNLYHNTCPHCGHVTTRNYSEKEYISGKQEK